MTTHTDNIRVGTRVRRTITPTWEGVVIRVITKRGLKPLVVQRDGGALFYGHYDQVEIVALSREGA